MDKGSGEGRQRRLPDTGSGASTSSSNPAALPDFTSCHSVGGFEQTLGVVQPPARRLARSPTNRTSANKSQSPRFLVAF